MKKLKINYEVVGFSEIDKTAIKCYTQNHSNLLNYGDITKINPHSLPDFDIFTGGFPCQSFSINGKSKGELDTRGTLFNDIVRIVEIKQPKYLLLENVKGLTTQKHKHTFDKIISELERVGYVVYWKVLNSKDFGIPQNRERVYIVCILNGFKTYKFPEKRPLRLCVRDILEKDRINPEIKNKSIEEVLLSPVSNERSIKSNILFELFGKIPSGLSQQKDRIFDIDKWCSTLITTQQEILFYDIKHPNLISLTPRECFRLMGFLNDEINIDGFTNSQSHKLVGNGWDINIVSLILENLL